MLVDSLLHALRSLVMFGHLFLSRTGLLARNIFISCPHLGGKVRLIRLVDLSRYMACEVLVVVSDQATG